MHQNAIKAIVDRAKAIAEEMVYVEPISCRGQKIVGGGHLASSYSLGENGETLRHKLIVETLLKKYLWHDKCSERYLDLRLQNILAEVLKTRDTSPVEPGISQLIADYETLNTEYQVIIPLVGVKVGDEPVHLGRIKIRQYEESLSAELTERGRTIIMANPRYSDDYKVRLFEQMDSRHFSAITGHACSEYIIAAEPIKARESTLEQTRLALDLLRYAILFLYDDQHPRAVGLIGDLPEQSRMMVSIRTDDQGVNIFLQATNIPLALDSDVIEGMKGIGVFDLSDIINRSSYTDFEHVLLRAVHWLASSQTQIENDNALLNLVACLETFFKVERGAPITANIAEGVALLTTSDLESRKKRKKLVTDLYDKRSTLTHEGIASVTDADVREMIKIVRDLTLVMIRHRNKFNSHKDFKDWLGNQKLNAEIRFP
jgi:hypothetical protein